MQAQRRARDPATGKSVVVGGMTYKQWAKQKRAENKTVWDVYVKKGKRLSSDREQHAQYRKLLDKHISKELDDFQNLKYNEPEKWVLLKLDKRRREELAAHPEKALSGERHVIPNEKITKYLFNPNNPDGWAKGKAFTSHLGYSLENWETLKREFSKGSRLYPSKFKKTNAFGVVYEQNMILYGTTGNPANVVVG